MIVFATQKAAVVAFRSNAPAAVRFVGEGGGGGRLLRTSSAAATAAADIMKSNRRRSYEPLFSHSVNHRDFIEHYRGQPKQRRGWHSSNTNMVNTVTRLHMSDMTVQEESSTTTPPQTATTTTTTSTSYPFATVEAKWQSYWKEYQTFATPSRRIVNQDGTVTRSTKKKKYVLDMFPYPSGAGLHVGHPEGYTGQLVSCLMCNYRLCGTFYVFGLFSFDLFIIAIYVVAFLTLLHSFTHAYPLITNPNQ